MVGHLGLDPSHTLWLGGVVREGDGDGHGRHVGELRVGCRVLPAAAHPRSKPDSFHNVVGGGDLTPIVVTRLISTFLLRRSQQQTDEDSTDPGA